MQNGPKCEEPKPRLCAQYEENPYPRWSRVFAETQVLPVDAYIGMRFPGVPYKPLGHRAPDVLIAGCGTGQHAIFRAQQLQSAHVLAIEHLQAGGEPRTYNLGSQHGFSVREVVAQAKKITGIDFPVVEAARRSGDPAVLVASSAKFAQDFSWQPRYSDLPTILQTAWDWHRANPDGYGG